jgi:hypothetical protein
MQGEQWGSLIEVVKTWTEEPIKNIIISYAQGSILHRQAYAVSKLRYIPCANQDAPACPTKITVGPKEARRRILECYTP